MAEIQALIDADLSEPYSIFTYRYFINQWPHLCMLVRTRPPLPRRSRAVPLTRRCS